jgi:Ca2+-binding RTX toxin-like protein
MEVMRVKRMSRAAAVFAGVCVAAGVLTTTATAGAAPANAVSVTITNGTVTVTDAPGVNTYLLATATKGKIWVNVQGIKPNGNLEHRAVQSVPAGCTKTERLHPDPQGNPGYTVLRCSGHSVRINGLDGNDKLVGAASNGSTEIKGGPGDDWIWLANRNLMGQRGVDRPGPQNAFGEDGDDKLFVTNHQFVDDVVSVGKGGPGNDTLRGFAPGNGPSTGGPGIQWLFGEDGNDVILAGGGQDWLVGGNGNDELRGNGGADTFHGGAGVDQFFGGPGADIFDARDNAGGDDIRCGGGRDTVQKDNGDITRGC